MAPQVQGDYALLVDEAKQPEWPAGQLRPGVELHWMEGPGKAEMAGRLREELEKLDIICVGEGEVRPGAGASLV
jgi:hypothetical protein